MAKNKSTVYLGYDDEEIPPKHVQHLNSNVNKIGGTPDWPSSDVKVHPCPLCGTARPLVVQLYAPLDHSQFHRSLYVFACLNPACSQNSKSWLCIRTQHLDTQTPADLMNAVPTPANCGPGGGKHKKQKQHNKQPQKINWCSGADDWGDVPSVAPLDAYEEMDTAADEENEENGNVVVVAPKQNAPQDFLAAGNFVRQQQQPVLVDDDEDKDIEDDDDDESTSMENDLICGFGHFDMNSPQNAGEDPNANCAAGIAAGAGDVNGGGNGATASICAEIEGAETDVVLVESPKKPERDLIALLKHTSTPAALGPLAKITDVTLKPFYMAVEIEQRNIHNEYENYGGSLSVDHVRELYQEYKLKDESEHSPNSASASGSNVGAVNDGVVCGSGAAASGGEQEAYEKIIPAHGDIVFHNFLTTIQQNPGQILRYSRDTLPLLIAPLTEPVPKCQNCNGDTICEVQILSTLIPKLRLQQNAEPVPIEYGNVLVFTCLKSCWDTPDKMRFERVIVQAEL